MIRLPRADTDRSTPARKTSSLTQSSPTTPDQLHRREVTAEAEKKVPDPQHHPPCQTAFPPTSDRAPHKDGRDINVDGMDKGESSRGITCGPVR
jgi:hypothetical protein